MLGVMAVSILGEARLAKIIIFASRAVDKLALGEFYQGAFSNSTIRLAQQENELTLDAAVAGSHVAKTRPAVAYRVHESRRRLMEKIRDGAADDWHGILRLVNFPGLFRHGGTKLQLLLGEERLGRAVHNLTVLHGSSDQPVLIVVARNAPLNAGLAQVKVAVVTGGAVVVGIGNRLVAAVAAHGKPTPAGRARSGGADG